MLVASSDATAMETYTTFRQKSEEEINKRSEIRAKKH